MDNLLSWAWTVQMVRIVSTSCFMVLHFLKPFHFPTGHITPFPLFFHFLLKSKNSYLLGSSYSTVTWLMSTYLMSKGLCTPCRDACHFTFLKKGLWDSFIHIFLRFWFFCQWPLMNGALPLVQRNSALPDWQLKWCQKSTHRRKCYFITSHWGQHHYIRIVGLWSRVKVCNYITTGATHMMKAFYGGLAGCRRPLLHHRRYKIIWKLLLFFFFFPSLFLNSAVEVWGKHQLSLSTLIIRLMTSL